MIRAPRAESYHDLSVRLEPVLVELEREKEDLLIIGHSSVIRCLLAYLIGLPASEIARGKDYQLSHKDETNYDDVGYDRVVVQWWRLDVRVIRSLRLGYIEVRPSNLGINSSPESPSAIQPHDTHVHLRRV
ncbi:hypothetical protein OG21DRAFT_753218 [Imleria badia]|nr:hypothetical protein OG21DRAFT_753218 [Imleria badia]